MENISNFFEWIKSIQVEAIIDIFIGILIFILFKCLSKSFAYAIIRILKHKTKNKKEIRNSPFYKTLAILFVFLGAYIGIMFIKRPLGISESLMKIINKIFRILIIIVLANGFSNSLTVKSKIINKIKQRVNPKVEDTMLGFILKIIKIIIYVIAGFLVLTELNYNLNGLVAGLGIGSVVLTLSAQDTVKNLFEGLVIFLDRPFIVGDWIEIGEFEGNVEDITIRSTRVRTFENSLVNIPNSVIAKDSIINWSKMEKRRNKVNLCLELDTTIEKVRIVQNRIKEMLKQHDDVIDDTIIVKFDNITENGINLLICSYTNSIDYTSFLNEKEKINYNIIQILREENVELAYDTKSIRIKNKE